MINLEDLRRAAFAVQGMSGDPNSMVRMGPADALLIADELEAAREVVEAGRAVDRKDPGCHGRLYRALAAYDRVQGRGGRA